MVPSFRGYRPTSRQVHPILGIHQTRIPGSRLPGSHRNDPSRRRIPATVGSPVAPAVPEAPAAVAATAVNTEVTTAWAVGSKPAAECRAPALVPREAARAAAPRVQAVAQPVVGRALALAGRGPARRTPGAAPAEARGPPARRRAPAV